MLVRTNSGGAYVDRMEPHFKSRRAAPEVEIILSGSDEQGIGEERMLVIAHCLPLLKRRVLEYYSTGFGTRSCVKIYILIHAELMGRPVPSDEGS